MGQVSKREDIIDRLIDDSPPLRTANHISTGDVAERYGEQAEKRDRAQRAREAELDRELTTLEWSQRHFEPKLLGGKVPYWPKRK